MKNRENQKHASKRPDFRLALGRLEERIILGKDEERCRALLRRRENWRALPPDAQVEWARLCQMAGEIDAALDVLQSVNQSAPSLEAGWTAHLELLSLLGHRERLAQVAALARRYVGSSKVGGPLKTSCGPRDEEPLEEAVLTPFARLRQRQEQVARFLDLFSGREDCFARQWVDKAEGRQGYVPVRRPMEEADVEAHLSGKRTYGIYLMRTDSTVKTAVIDVDIAPRFRAGRVRSEEKRLILRERAYLFTRIGEKAEETGLHPVCEFSGAKGFHFWFFFEEPLPASRVRAVLEAVCAGLSKDLTAFHLEVFPKQDNLAGKGLGNLVKLPLGIHRLTGKRSYFLECKDRSPEAQLAYLGRVLQSSAAALDLVPADRSRAKVLVHPRMKEWAEHYPELANLETKCPPLGQVIALCRSGACPSMREEKVLFQTLGFLPRAKTLLHHLLGGSAEYNPHRVDYKLSRLRGKPLGCKRIHSLMQYAADICPFDRKASYAHPLLHVPEWKGEKAESEKVNDLFSALENLKTAIVEAEAFLK